MRKKILIVDDEPDIRDIVRFYLVDQGFEVVEASNGQDGIIKAIETRPDLIVLDIMMPGINGFEVAKHLKDDPNTRHIPIIILSVLSMDSEYRQGILDYISKPFEQQDLIQKVRRIFEQVDRTTNEMVLVVDDDPDIVDIVTLCLKENSLPSEKAYNGIEALDKARHRRYGLILLDINMPGMNGFEVIKHLKEDDRTRDIPVVVLTGTYISEEDRKHGLRLGVVKYLTKPFSAGDLVADIKEALHVKNSDSDH